MTFSFEVEMAIGFVLDMVYAGRYMNPNTPAPAPSWSNFQFFGDIRPGKPSHVRRLSPADVGSYGCWGWWVSREVEFYHRGQLVATVGLQGLEVDPKRYEDATPMWAVSHVRYAARFDRAEPENWQEHIRPITALISAGKRRSHSLR
jgi:hypothetical protein